MKFTKMVATLAIVGGLVASGCTESSDSSSSSGSSTSTSAARGHVESKLDEPTSLKWTSCTEKTAAAANLQCSRLEVPLDPSKPKGQTIELELARQNSTGEISERIGSIVLNPGGPGASGIEFLANAVSKFPAELTQRFDLVSFDPRGVGSSTPVDCISDKVMAEQLTGDLSPDTEAEISEAIDEQKQMRKGCETNSPELVTHMSTADVAADLDQIREALGDEKLTYVGFSYGTAIGATYATLFPERTRALVLDGSVNPKWAEEDDTLTQALGFEQVLGEFTEDCDASETCPLGPDSKAAIDQVREKLRSSPLEVDSQAGSRTMGVDQFDYGLATGLYDTSVWGALASSISTIRDGGADLIFALMDLQTGRKPDGSFTNSTEAQTMVNCADSRRRPSKDEAIEQAANIAAAAPTFGPLLGWSGLSCLGWPEASNPVPAITGAGSPPILVIGTKGDPATPYEWSKAMAVTLESGSLLTYEGSGHTAFLRGGECVDSAVSTYLIDRTLPTSGKTCPAVESAVSFKPLSDEVISQLVSAGLDEDLARCVIEATIRAVGEGEFNRMVLEQDTEKLTQQVSANTLACASSSRNRQ